MSAYIVSNETINTIIAHYKNNARGHSTRSGLLSAEVCREFPCNEEAWAMLGLELCKMNERAISERYGEDAVNEFTLGLPYKYRASYPPSLPVVYGCISCLLYQCSEGNVPDCELYQKLSNEHDRIAHKLIRDLAESLGVKIPWGL